MTDGTEELRYPDWLVQTDWLEAHLDDPGLRIFDCTMKLVPDPKATYQVEDARADWEKAHVPGAGYLDLQGELSDPTTKLRFMLPAADRFAEAMSRHGVGPGSRVVLYSAGAIFWATRIFWMLRAFGFDDAAVLDGGWKKWQLEARPVSTSPPRHPPARFVARPVEVAVMRPAGDLVGDRRAAGRRRRGLEVARAVDRRDVAEHPRRLEPAWQRTAR